MKTGLPNTVRPADRPRGIAIQDNRPGMGITARMPDAPGGLFCWLVRSPTAPPDAVPLVAVHGIRRRAQDQAALLAARAAELGRTIVAPLFDETNWPKYQQTVRRGRADLALLSLMDDLKAEGFWSGDQFELSGFSGGAQFAHRFAMLHPDRVRRLTVCSPGWLTFPDDAPFPYGLGNKPNRSTDWGAEARSRLDKFLSIPMTVAVGAKDCEPDANTRRGESIDRQQGNNRLERATRWTFAMRAEAHRRHVHAQIDLKILPRCGHSFNRCVRRGGLDKIILSAGDDGAQADAVSTDIGANP